MLFVPPCFACLNHHLGRGRSQGMRRSTSIASQSRHPLEAHPSQIDSPRWFLPVMRQGLASATWGKGSCSRQLDAAWKPSCTVWRQAWVWHLKDHTIASCSQPQASIDKDISYCEVHTAVQMPLYPNFLVSPSKLEAEACLLHGSTNHTTEDVAKAKPTAAFWQLHKVCQGILIQDLCTQARIHEG